MAEKKFDNLSGGIGDLGNILHNQGVTDLSWLAVDEKAYREAEALPRQNLDIIPELQKALARQDGDDVPSLIPLKPHVIVNRNPLDAPEVSKVDMTNPIRNRVARLVMEGLPPSRIHDRVLLEFSPADVRRAGAAVSEVMAERGLLGNVYIDSSHFPRCHQQLAADKKLITACAKRSLMVLSKPACDGCVHNQNGRCASFKKPLASRVPYGPKLAARFVEQFQAEKRDFSPPDTVDPTHWRSAIASAFLSDVAPSRPDGVLTVRTQQKVAGRTVSREEVESFLDREKPSSPSAPSAAYVKYARRMMDGTDDREFLTASGDPVLVSLASEFGLLGHTWVDMDAAGSCKRALAVMEASASKFASSDGVRYPDYVVRRSSSCQHCRGASDGACAKISKLSSIIPALPGYGRKTLIKALARAAASGRITVASALKAASFRSPAADWRSLTSQVNLFVPEAQRSEYAGQRISLWSGRSSSELDRPEMNEDEVRRTISGIMNHGASGEALKKAVLSRYSRRDLESFPELGRKLASEDGIQGHFYIDPTAYLDYGSGCSEGASKFRKLGAPNVMASSKCTGCVLQTHPGWCSKYAKDMVRNVPDEIRVASRRRLPVIKSAPVENPVEKYGLASSMTVEPSYSKKVIPEISMDMGNVDGQ